jgi:peptide/nickel transport system permease protein
VTDGTAGGHDGGRRLDAERRTVALAVGLAGVAGLAAYSSLVDPVPVVAGLRRIDLLFVSSLYALGLYGVVPLVTDRDRTRRYLGTLRRRPLALASLGYVTLFVVVGLVGPLVLEADLSLAATHQPPVLFGVDASYTTDCLGTVAGGQCRGTWRHPLGTTKLGTDVLVLSILGMREALVFASVVAALLVPVATAVGVVAGYRRGLTDELLMRFVDVQQTIPAFVVYVVLAFLYGESQFLLVVVFGLTSWGGVARIVRNETLQVREDLFVTAARVSGTSELGIARRHVLPNLAGAIATAVTRQIPLLLLVEAALSYMKLTPVGTSWGRTIREGMSYFPEAWWVSVAPVAFLTATVVALSLLGDALRDVLDPRMEG